MCNKYTGFCMDGTVSPHSVNPLWVELQFLHTLSSIWSALYCIFVFADEDFASSFLASCKFFFLSTENVQLTDQWVINKFNRLNTQIYIKPKSSKQMNVCIRGYIVPWNAKIVNITQSLTRLTYLVLWNYLRLTGKFS